MSRETPIESLSGELLHVLHSGPILSTAEMAVLLGKSQEQVAEALEELKRQKVFVGWRPVINWDRWNEDRVVALIDVKLTPEREKGFDKVAQRIARFPQVRSLHLMSGTYDLSVVVEGKTLQDVASFVSAKLAPIDQVTSTTTHFILKTFKDDGVFLDSEDEDPRLGVMP